MSIRLSVIRKKMCAALLLCLWMVIFVSSISGCAEENETRAVRVGYYINTNFQEGASDDEVKSGYGYEYLRKVASYSGWKYEYVYGEWSELYGKLLKGELDVMAGLSYTSERAPYISYPDYEMGKVAYYLYKHDTDHTISETDPSSLSGKRIGGVRDTLMVSCLREWSKKNQVDLEIIEYDGFEEERKAFHNNEIDGCVETDFNILPDSGYTAVIKVGESPYYLAVAKGRQDLLDELNEALTKINGVEPYYIQNLQSNYYDDSAVNNSLTDGEAEWVRNHSVMNVGYYESYLPYSGTDRDGNATGLMTDVMEEILNKLQIKDQVSLHYQPYQSYEEMVEDLHTGKLDMIFPAGGELWNAEQDGVFVSSPVVSAGVDLAFVGSYDDKTAAVIAVNSSNKMQYYYTVENYPDAEILFCDSVEGCLDAVLSGEAGSTILNGIRTNSLLSDSRYGSMISLQLSRSDDFCFAVVDGNNDLLLLLNRGIKLIGKDYGMNASHKYMVYQYTAMDFIRENAIPIVLLVSAIAAVIILLLIRDSVRSRKYSAAIEKSRNDLADALKIAEEASQAKTRFLFNMSHDIRTPMNAIIGFTNLLEKRCDNVEQRSDYIRKIKSSSDFLLSLINNVLEMSRIESGKAVLDEVPWSVEQFNDSIYSVFDEQMKAKGIEFVREIHVEHEYVYCDSIKLREVFHNILSNAWKYTPEGGKIAMILHEIPSDREGYACFQTEITDTGIGMSKEYLPHLFEEFTREKTTTESKVGGTGLGMTIVKRLVDMMGGTVRVESEPGKGTKFTVTLSHRIAHETELQTDSVQAVQSDTFRGKRILLAEDNELNVEIAEELLREAGFQVEHAPDGQICVDMVKRAEAGYYDLILMDIQMPRMNGYEAAQTIRKMTDKKKATIPILALTANAFAQDKKEAERAGMNGHLAKPVNVSEMMRVLKETLQKA